MSNGSPADEKRGEKGRWAPVQGEEGQEKAEGSNHKYCRKGIVCVCLEMAGSAKDLQKSGTEALQALVRSLSPEIGGTVGDGEKFTPEQIKKLDELVGADEQGLPIMDISEYLPEGDSVPSHEPPTSIEEPEFIQFSSLSEEERQRRRIERDRILDTLEEEERREQTKGRRELPKEQRQELLQKRKDEAKVEAEKLKMAKALQKKMGKALLQGLADDRDKAEKMQKQSPRNTKKKQGKSVAFADIPSDAQAGKEGPSSITNRTGTKATPLVNARGGSQTIKPHVVERFPARSASERPDIPDGTSADKNSPPRLTLRGSTDRIDASHKHKEPPQDIGEESDIDIAERQHEITTEYYKKRGNIGEEALKTMNQYMHHNADNEWNQPEVPLDATLSSPPPKPPVSRFKANRLAAANNHAPASSTSLDSTVIPVANSQALQRAIRVGKLEGNHLISAADSGGESDDESMRKALEMLKSNNRSLEKIRDADQSASSIATTATDAQLDHRPAVTFKTSRFKPSPRSESPPILSGQTTPISHVERSSPKLLDRPSVVERQLSGQIEQISLSSYPSGSNSTTGKLPRPDMIDMTPESGMKSSSQFPMIVDSTSFIPPPDQTADSTARPNRPPAMMASIVRESGEVTDKNVLQGRNISSQRRISRFMAERS